MKKILMAALLVSGISVYGAELPEIQNLMVTNQFGKAC